MMSSMQRISILCNVTMISHCWLTCSRLIVVSVQYERVSVTHCWASLTVTFAEELKLMSALWCRLIQSALIAYLSATFVINAQQSLWSLLLCSLRDLMLLFCVCMSMMTREAVTHCKSVFSNPFSFIFYFYFFVLFDMTICCINCHTFWSNDRIQHANCFIVTDIKPQAVIFSQSLLTPFIFSAITSQHEFTAFYQYDEC